MSYDAMILKLQRENTKCSNCSVYQENCLFCVDEAGSSGIHLIKVRQKNLKRKKYLSFFLQDDEMNKFIRQGYFPPPLFSSSSSSAVPLPLKLFCRNAWRCYCSFRFASNFCGNRARGTVHLEKTARVCKRM